MTVDAAGVEDGGAARVTPKPPVGRSEAMAQFLGLERAGLIGGGAAGLIGGSAYGFTGIAGGGTGGSLSGLIVLATLTAVVGMLGGASVGFEVGAVGFFPQRREPGSCLAEPAADWSWARWSGWSDWMPSTYCSERPRRR